jgi:hypothetical protein
MSCSDLKSGQGKICMAMFTTNNRAGSSAMYRSSYLVSTSHIGDPWSQAAAPSHLGGTPSWVVPCGQHVLSRASTRGPSIQVAR